MLKIEKTILPSPDQWKIVIEGARNPMNSWARSDSYATHIENAETLNTADFEFFLGDADHDLMSRLAKGGPVHAKYRRMIPVFVTLTAPLYFLKEWDTYKIGTVTNSCSTMHKIHSKEFSLKDFSWEHLDHEEINVLESVIRSLNWNREKFLETKDKQYWWHMIQMLPTSYEQKRTVMLNYEVLNNIYHSRKDHKLDEWKVFCEWIEELPYSELIIGG